ncbi:tRNA pseudouridine synthase-like 1 isoform X1 [Hetaerina americana]|uniref:tRNA pseudouridine synthase-like 1 isoform X1 n=1 Tax=Hetaerina americana TaxID=62018 RepID=UPI003A7F218D
MRRYLLTYSYIGSNFRGVQKNLDLEDKLKGDPESVQGILEIAIKRFKPANCPKVVVSSRTDIGVHALENSAHVDLDHPQVDCPTWPEYMLYGMNRYFSKAHADLWIKNIQAVPDTFHARFSAKSRTYLYRLAILKPCQCQDAINQYSISVPMGEWKRCCFIGNSNFDVDKVRKAASFFIGLKDFQAFTRPASHHPEGYSTIRHINEMTITPGLPMINSIHDSRYNLYNFWDIVVNAKSFCYRQVRRMVAVLIAVAQNKIELDEVKLMIEDPQNNGWNPRATTAPPHGLFLTKVEYDPQDLIIPKQTEEETTKEIRSICD